MKNQKKIHKTKRPNGSTRVVYDFSHIQSTTDQSAAVDMTMASIKLKLDKGIMFPQNEPFYSSDLGIRNLQDVHARQQQTEKLFYQLPVEIRSLMQNDISNFESVIFDPKNKDLLSKYDLLVTKRDNHQELLHAITALKPTSSEPVEDTPKKAPKTVP